MVCSYPIMKPSLLLFSFLSLLLLSFSSSVLGAGHHKPKHAQAPAPSLVVATPSTPALVEVPSPASDLAPAEGPTQDCSPYAHGLLECLDYLQAGSSSAKPDPTCCTDLREIVKEDVSCLCGLLAGNQDDFGFQINSSRVLSLPYTCSFTLPTSSECNALLGPTVATAPVHSGSQGSVDISSPPLPSESLAMALPVTAFTISAGIAVSMFSLIA